MALQVSTANGIKVYNISTGKSIPEWISERKRRSLLRNDEGLRRRIELIQDFTMPTAATHVMLTSDTQYILTAGVYKPRVRCYDTTQLSMKFERCVNSEVVAMATLSEDFSKFVLLLSDRHVNFHAQHGFHYQTRIPTFGRDLAYHYQSCDLYIPASNSEIYRLNLEQGRFLSPLLTQGRGNNVCKICKEHQLLAVGTESGQVECYDPRSRNRVGLLTVSQNISDNTSSPITALQFDNALKLGVGTKMGQVLLYDIRSCRPYCIKEHYYQLPINSLLFHSEQNIVMSSDKKALRLWYNDTGRPFTAIEPEHDINCVCFVPKTGLLFMAVENTQLLSYFIPSLGPAPRWCSFLDNLTEELEEAPQDTIYDDYKFVTSKELDELGLNHLVGTNILRAYMHGYFMDIRLYHKAKSIAEPFAYEAYRRQKIKQKIDEERISRVQHKKLPKVNKELAKKLLESETDTTSNKKKKSNVEPVNLLTDERFSALFTNPDYQLDTTSEEYKLLNPLPNKGIINIEEEELDSEEEGLDVDDDKDFNNEIEGPPTSTLTCPPVITLTKGDNDINHFNSTKVLLGRRLATETDTTSHMTSESTLGSQESTFKIKRPIAEARQRQANLTHRAERRNIRRSASSILPKQKKGPVYWRGKRIK